MLPFDVRKNVTGSWRAGEANCYTYRSSRDENKTFQSFQVNSQTVEFNKLDENRQNSHQSIPHSLLVIRNSLDYHTLTYQKSG